jgi:L-rhamnose-H+ transport protein
MGVILGVFLYAVGASCASICYTPQKKTVQWSWQTYWLAQASICWLALPLVVAWLTIPQLGRVLSEAPSDAMWKTFVLGATYGIGGTAFGIAIRHVGFSLTYAIAVGISCILGTLLPPLVHGQLMMIMDKTGAGWLVAGIAVGILGIALCGVAGRRKEIELLKSMKEGSFSLAKGLPLCILAGMLSAIYGFSLDQGQPIADVAYEYGAGSLQGNVIYIFSNTGAFLTTSLYCIYLHVKEKTFEEFINLKKGINSSRLTINYSMALITGVLWYAQFFFYGLGHVRMGEYKFSSWAIHMIMLVLLSTTVGLAMKEWSESRSSTRAIVVGALVTLISAVVMLSYGNYLGDLTNTN